MSFFQTGTNINLPTNLSWGATSSYIPTSSASSASGNITQGATSFEQLIDKVATTDPAKAREMVKLAKGEAGITNPTEDFINSYTPEYKDYDYYNNQPERDYAGNMWGRKTSESGVYEPGALSDLEGYAENHNQTDLLEEYKKNAESYSDDIVRALSDMNQNIDKLYNNSDVQYQNDQITQDVKNASGGFLNSSTTDNNIANAVASNTATAYNNAVTNAQNNAAQTIENIQNQGTVNQQKYNTMVEPLEDLTAYGTDFADTMYNASTGTAQSAINSEDWDETHWYDYIPVVSSGVKAVSEFKDMVTD